jgi:hypothetical protein
MSVIDTLLGQDTTERPRMASLEKLWFKLVRPVYELMASVSQKEWWPGICGDGRSPVSVEMHEADTNFMPQALYWSHKHARCKIRMHVELLSKPAPVPEAQRELAPNRAKGLGALLHADDSQQLPC